MLAIEATRSVYCSRKRRCVRRRREAVPPQRIVESRRPGQCLGEHFGQALGARRIGEIIRPRAEDAARFETASQRAHRFGAMAAASSSSSARWYVPMPTHAFAHSLAPRSLTPTSSAALDAAFLGDARHRLTFYICSIGSTRRRVRSRSEHSRRVSAIVSRSGMP